MIFVRKSTAQTEKVGPFLDKTDGVTEEVGLGGDATEISKDGGAFATGPVLGTHDAEGWYPVALTTDHTDTLGSLVIKSHAVATHLPVWHSFQVIPAKVYDSLVLGTDNLEVDKIQDLGTGSAALVGGRLDVNVGAMVANVITAASIATSAIDADALASDAADQIADALLDRADGVEPASAGTERTVREALRIILASAAGILAGAATTNVTIQDTNNTKARITATVDANGNRSAVTLIDT